MSSKYTPAFSADKMHVYMLGKNLYQALTGYPAIRLIGIRSLDNTPFSNASNFSASIFNIIPIGKLLKTQLQQMIQYSPNRRCTLNEARKELDRIRLYLEINALLRKIKATSWLRSDVEMPKYIAELTKKLTPSTETEKLQEIIRELTKLHNQLSPIATEVQAIVTRFKTATFDKKAKNTKAFEIENTFHAIPVADRVNVLTARKISESVKNFQNALAFHRKESKSQLNEEHKTQQEDLDVRKTADTFKEFKLKFEHSVATDTPAVTTPTININHQK